ncbi:hypothetical protein ACRRTK_024441 [Alexandromys fortis]
MATMKLLLLNAGLTLLSVAAADEGALAIPGAAYRVVTFPASTEKLLGKWYIIRWAGNMPIPLKRKSRPLPPFTFVINILGKLEFRMKIMKPIGCVLFKQYLDALPTQPGLFKARSRHYILIYFMITEDLAVAHYQDNFTHPTYIMTMLMGRSPVVNPKYVKPYDIFVVNIGLNRTDIVNPSCDGSPCKM